MCRDYLLNRLGWIPLLPPCVPFFSGHRNLQNPMDVSLDKVIVLRVVMLSAVFTLKTNNTMKKIFYTPLFMALLLSACHSDEIVPVPDEKVAATSVSNLADHKLYFSRGILKSGSTLVALASVDDYNGLAIDLDSGEERPFFPHRYPDGKKILTSMSFNSTDGHTLTALDYRRGRLMVTTLPAAASRSASPADESFIQLPAYRQHLVAAMGTGFVIATGLYNEGRYLYYDLSSRESTYHLSYPGHRDYPRLSTPARAVLYASSILRLHPDESAFVCADMYSGLLDFCRIVNGSIERTRLVRLHHPEVYISEEPSLEVAYYRDSRLGFVDLAVTRECVYALYSGRAIKDYGNDASLGDILLVYDWDGNLLRSCHLDVSLRHLAYDPEEQALYGLSDINSDELLKLNI